MIVELIRNVLHFSYAEDSGQYLVSLSVICYQELA